MVLRCPFRVEECAVGWLGFEGKPMTSALLRFRKLICAEDGPTAVEYAILLAVIVVAAVGGLSLFGVHMDNIYTMVSSTVPLG